MAEIRVNVSANKTQKVEITPGQVQNQITATPDSSQYYSNLAKSWAIDENLVQGTDYSSKYYAGKSSESATIAESYANAAEDTFNNVQVATETSLANIETARVDAVDNINSTKTTILSDIEFVADGEKEEIGELANTIKDSAKDIINRIGLNMFDTVLKDHELSYEESKGLALQGTWVYKTAISGERYGYPDFYNKCLEEYNVAKENLITMELGGVSINMYVHSNGHLYYNASTYKETIDNWFNTLGTAWFYGVDTKNERVFLPRTLWFEQMTNNKDDIGKSVEAGLPNITGDVGYSQDNFANYTKGAFSTSGSTTKVVHGGTASGTTNANLAFNASRSNPIYGNSNTVQPNAVKKLLYICVGNTVSDTSWVDVVTQVNGGVKDLEDKKNASIAEIDANAKSYDNLTKRQITNCLLEVPQNIKLELNNGVLTLKAGSVVTVPNGFEADGVTPKFDYVTVESDATGLRWVGANIKQYMCFYNIKANGLDGTVQDKITSSTSFPASVVNGDRCYRTDLNELYTYRTSSGAWTKEDCLPIGIITTAGVAGKIGSIDQVFNGMGYIGSTIWVDKGVKGLYPNGRNEDGTLNNIEIATDRITILNVPANYNQAVNLYQDGHISYYGYEGIFEQITPPTGGQNMLWYNPNTNEWKYTTNAGATWYFVRLTPIASVKTGASYITNYIPKQPFRAVDYNDKTEISGWGMPSDKYIDLTLGASGTEYTAPANGWFSLRKVTNGTNQSLNLVNMDSGMVIDCYAPYNNQYMGVIMPAQKGQKVMSQYTAGGAVQWFRFIYAEGEV